MNEEKIKAYSLYKKSIRTDALIMFFLAPIFFFLLYFILKFSFAHQESTALVYISGGITVTLYMLSPFYNRYIFGNKSFAMKKYKIKISNSWSPWYLKIYFNVLHVILISKYNPWFGQDFNEICVNALEKTKVDIVFDR